MLLRKELSLKRWLWANWVSLGIPCHPIEEYVYFESPGGGDDVEVKETSSHFGTNIQLDLFKEDFFFSSSLRPKNKEVLLIILSLWCYFRIDFRGSCLLISADLTHLASSFLSSMLKNCPSLPKDTDICFYSSSVNTESLKLTFFEGFILRSFA